MKFKNVLLLILLLSGNRMLAQCRYYIALTTSDCVNCYYALRSSIADQKNKKNLEKVVLVFSQSRPVEIKHFVEQNFSSAPTIKYIIDDAAYKRIKIRSKYTSTIIGETACKEAVYFDLKTLEGCKSFFKNIR